MLADESALEDLPVGTVLEEPEDGGEPFTTQSPILAVAHSLGLTADKGYRGVLPASILAYRFGKPPADFLVGLAKEVAAVLQQAYVWLGGVGNAVDNAWTSVKTVSTSNPDWPFPKGSFHVVNGKVVPGPAPGSSPTAPAAAGPWE